jgi:hypothetical protein
MTELRQHPNSIVRQSRSARRAGKLLATLLAFGASSAVMAAEPTSAPTAAPTHESAQATPSGHRDGSDKTNAVTDDKTANAETQQQAFTDYVKTSRGWVIGDVQLVRV